MKARLFLQPCFFSCARVCSEASHRSHRSHRICTPGVKSHRGSPHPCSLRLTQISLIPLNCTPDGKSHRGFTLLLKKRHPILSI